MIRFKYITSLTLFWGCFNLLAQTDQGGFIEPNDTTKFASERVIHLPQGGVVLYKKPNGEYAGKISNTMPPYIQIPPGQPTTLFATIQWRNIRPTLLDLSFFFKTYDDLYYIQFDKFDDGFVRIVNTPYEAWISVETIRQSGFKMTSWMEFYGVQDRVITVPSGKTLALRASPYADSEILTTLDDELFFIKVIAFDNTVNSCCEGRFCHVEVTRYKENPCRNGDYSENNIKEIFKGWVEIIDENGSKIITHNAGGC